MIQQNNHNTTRPTLNAAQSVLLKARQGRLVKKYKSVVSHNKSVRYELQDTLHKSIIRESGNHSHRCLSCGKMPISVFGRDSSNEDHSTDAHVTLSHSEHGFSYQNVMKCNNSHYCPVCAPKVLSEKADQVSAIEKSWLNHSSDHTTVLVTLTVSHTSEDDPIELNKKIAEAKRKMSQATAFRNAKKDIGYYSSINALEQTVSSKNGLHPHFHDAWFLTRRPDVSELIELQQLMVKKWKHALNNLGLDCSLKRGVNISFTLKESDHYNNYDTTSTFTQAQLSAPVTTKGLSSKYLSKISKELTFSFTKDGRHGNRSFFQLLFDLYTQWSSSDSQLVYKYVQSVAGRARLYINPKINKWFKENLEEDDQEDDNVLPLITPVYEFSHDDWRKLCFSGNRSKVISYAEENKGDLAKIRSYISQLLSVDVQYLPPTEYKVMSMKKARENAWSWILSS